MGFPLKRRDSVRNSSTKNLKYEETARPRRSSTNRAAAGSSKIVSGKDMEGLAKQST